MDKRRLKKVESLIRDELGSLIVSQAVNDPRIDPLVSITAVEVAPDLALAKVFVSYYGKREKGDEITEALNHAAGFLQKELVQRVKLRITPRLAFFYDESIERGFRITETLKKIGPQS
ncbi:MAG: 30S ribosome-binding factor RbfA [Spirochaetaceae bacterium]|nr:MAG: 30S ribosome-binding factor RbfA [Spirochaetaceae bacterium]